ncbi:MAG TPA: ABC transporter ATP-binding protein [Candidatus Fimimorpha excrementavium]|nr:ABC transporter ATP-binding protein [Candidatus Fimimorpha excrementavium]
MKLELKDVTHVYPNGKKALDHVSLGLMPGIYGLLGPNGAGKSTMMKIITDHLLPTSGQVLFQGKDIRKVSREFRSCLGYMPQQQGMYQQFTGRRFLWYMASLKGLRRREAKDRIAHLLEVVNLTEAADRKIGGYSGGMKQRLLIAQAVLNEPEVLVLDEPTAGLDPKERIRIRNFVSELSRDRVVIFATHVVSDVECIAREVMLMKEGKLIKKGTPAELTGEMEGLVWEFLADPSELEAIQKQYLISNLAVTGEGILVKAVGNEQEIPRKKQPVRASMEEVYLYYIEGQGASNEKGGMEDETVRV